MQRTETGSGEFREKSGEKEEISKEDYLINTFMEEYLAAQSQN